MSIFYVLSVSFNTQSTKYKSTPIFLHYGIWFYDILVVVKYLYCNIKYIKYRLICYFEFSKTKTSDLKQLTCSTSIY